MTSSISFQQQQALDQALYNSPSMLIDKFIRPYISSLSSNSLQNLQKLIIETKQVMSKKEFIFHLQQWKFIGKKLNSNNKINYLSQYNFRLIIIELIKQQSVHLLKISYFNRAKIDQDHIQFMKKLKPQYFLEVIMIASKLNIIYKHNYKKLNNTGSQNNTILKIINILALCDDKKRSINNNKAKFLSIVQNDNDRFQLTKELGMMLRQAWKKDKKKTQNQLQDNNIDYNDPFFYRSSSQQYFSQEIQLKSSSIDQEVDNINVDRKSSIQCVKQIMKNDFLKDLDSESYGSIEAQLWDIRYPSIGGLSLLDDKS